MNLSTVEIKAFVPARDLQVSLDFYRVLGFETPWTSDDIAHVRHGDTSFLLQRFFVADHARNFVMHLLVENADDWHAHVRASGVAKAFGAEVSDVQEQPWRMRDFTLTDPTGVLWRIAHNI